MYSSKTDLEILEKRKMEKKALIVSNACLDKYENTLGSFKNSLPKGYLLSEKEWTLGIESLGVNCVFADLNHTPKLIKVLCMNVRGILKNESVCKEIGIVSIKKSDVGSYFFTNFLLLQHFEFENRVPEFIHIKLVDEFDQLIRFASGPPTFVKLHFSLKKMNSFNVRISSHKTPSYPSNTPNKFRVNLMKNLKFFNGKPRVALTSIILWNRNKHTSDLNLGFKVHKENEIFDYTIDREITNCDDMLKDIREKVKEVINLSETNGRIEITAKSDIKLTVSRDLAFFLGFTNLEKGRKMRLQLSENASFMPRYKLQQLPLLPTHLFLYSNIVKPSLIGDGLHCLLKVIPMCYKQSDSYHTYEFEHNEFLPIATS